MKNKVTVTTLKKKKQNNQKITALTAYDYCTASILDELEFDIILVGDSLGMVVLGYDSTIPVTVEEIVHHSKAVTRAVKRSFVVADMPFMSYQASIEDAVRNAGRLVKQGNANAVKLEGGEEIAETVTKLVESGIPVMGHVGLRPQSVNKTGGYKVQGKTKADADKIISDVKILEKSGCFAIVLECVPHELAKEITEILDIPTIGIGAGKDCDGQILVVNDMLGMSDKPVPSFVKKYADLNSIYRQAFQAYKKDVESNC
jgi:3-methyl-2-oxobutanoate hydroxymethyltransferase